MKLRLLVWLFVIASVGAPTIYLWGAYLGWQAGRAPIQQVQASAQQLEHGRYLATAGDCVSCHTSKGGAPWAGGVPLKTPFGTIYGTNITPDPVYGIGRYTAEEFHTVVTQGRARDGRLLYPAMPYNSYVGLTRQDTDAMRAWLMQQRPVAQPNRKPDLAFPANLRIGLLFWQALFAGRSQPPSSEGSSANWQRGKYLVEVLGHCGECHTPRGMLGQQKIGDPMSGNPGLGKYAAPDVRPGPLALRGWDAEELQRYLRAGAVDHGVASDEMLTVVRMSTSHLSDQDLVSMSTYLLGDKPPMPAATVGSLGPPDQVAQGDYLVYCSGCHGVRGQGVPNVAVQLAGNTTLRDPNAHNLIRALLVGLPEHDLPGLAHMQAMPGFADDLDDARTAALATWLRQSFGGQPAKIDANEVKQLRDSLSDE